MRLKIISVILDQINLRAPLLIAYGRSYASSATAPSVALLPYVLYICARGISASMHVASATTTMMISAIYGAISLHNVKTSPFK